MTPVDDLRRLADNEIAVAWATFLNDLRHPDTPFPVPLNDIIRAGKYNVEQAYAKRLAAVESQREALRAALKELVDDLTYAPFDRPAPDILTRARAALKEQTR